MNICLFGNFSIEAAVRFQSDKIRALFAYLAAHAGDPVPRGQIAPLLWGGFPDKAAKNNARISLSRLKKAMAPASAQYGDNLLQITRKTVQLTQVDGVQIDYVNFEQLWARCEEVDRGQWVDRGQIIHALTQLVMLYHGPFLDGFLLDDAMEFDEWVTLKRESAHQRILIALETLAEHHLARSNWDKAQYYAERQLLLEPWHELAHCQLIQAHHRAGRRDAALAQYERCQKVLGEELGAEPSSTTIALFELIRDERNKQSAAAPSFTTIRLKLPTATVPNNLPTQLTPFVGRSAELAQVKQLLAGRSYRLITLIGQGGIGKTRLALTLAASQLRFFAQGVFFVNLTAVSHTSGIVEAIAEAVGMSLIGKREPLAQISDYLREREMLLILDNMEHLLGDDAPVDTLLALLSAAPNLTLLLTSRQRLWVRAETVVSLEGLTYPKKLDDGQLAAFDKRQGTEKWRQFDAVRLFVERMGRAQVGYDPTADLPFIYQICQLVDGLPLALELAATQSSMDSCAAIAEAITNCMRTLTTRMRDLPKRQRSLEAVFDYSWCLLAGTERRVLAQLSMFRGGFDWAAVQAIVPEVTEALLQKLVGHSLLRQQLTGRYDLHEMVRQFAATHLDTKSRTTLETRYVNYYLAWWAGEEAALEGRDPQLSVAKLLPDFNNLQHAWQQAIAFGTLRPIEQATQALSNYLQLRGQHHLGRDLFQNAATAAEQARDADASQALPHLLTEAARFYIRLSKFETAIAYTKRAINQANANNSMLAIGNASNVMSEAFWRMGKYEDALDILDSSKQPVSAAASLRLEGTHYFNYGAIWLFRSDYHLAQENLQKALSIWHQLQHRRFEAITLNSIGLSLVSQGEHTAGEEVYTKALQLQQAMHHEYEVARVRTNLAHVAIGKEVFDSAIILCQQALSYYQHTGDLETIALNSNNLGWAYFKLQDLFNAEKYLKQALRYAQQSDDRLRELMALSNLGEVSASKGLINEAICILEEAHQGWIEFGHTKFSKFTGERVESLHELSMQRLRIGN
ncbi:MAG: tetratricopeptide repeat protein [Candidatus Promineifilaceae bacterium]